MDYGLILPHFGACAHEDPAQRILTAATTAEELGYSTLWVADHVIFPAKIEGGYAFNPEEPFLDPLTVLAALAYKTTKIKLGTAVLLLPYRHPLATAKALATIDVLSGGRTVVGVGAGWSQSLPPWGRQSKNAVLAPTRPWIFSRRSGPRKRLSTRVSTSSFPISNSFPSRSRSRILPSLWEE